MRIIQLFILILLLMGLFSCETKRPDKARIPLLEVEGKFLYLDQLEGIVPANSSSADSIQIVESYIRKWTTDILLYETAKRNITNKAEIDKLLDDYRKSLIIHQYQQNMLSQKLTSKVPEDSIRAFYQKYSQQFLLEETIVKGVLLVLPVGAPKLDKVKTWVRKADTKSLEEIEKYSLQHGLSYDYFADQWIPLQEIQKKSSSQFELINGGLQINQLYEVSDSLKHCLLSLDSIKRVGDVEPYELAKDKIAYLVMNQWKSDFIKNFEKDLYRDALQNGTITKFKY